MIGFDYYKINAIYDVMNRNELFGQNIRRMREGQNFSQAGFAEACGISRAYYGRIERGEHSATIEMQYRIADGLGVHISELFRELP